MLKDNLTLPGRTILVTGAAGFIGSNLAGRLLEMGAKVIGIDSMTDYYDVNIKRERLRRLEGYEGFVFVEDSIARKEAVTRIFTEHAPSKQKTQIKKRRRLCSFARPPAFALFRGVIHWAAPFLPAAFPAPFSPGEILPAAGIVSGCP